MATIEGVFEMTVESVRNGWTTRWFKNLSTVTTKPIGTLRVEVFKDSSTSKILLYGPAESEASMQQAVELLVSTLSSWNGAMSVSDKAPPPPTKDQWRLFPVIQQNLIIVGKKRIRLDTPPFIPWSLLEPYRAAIERFHGQTLERLAERGGLSPTEIKLHVVCGSNTSKDGWAEPEAAAKWLSQWLHDAAQKGGGEWRRSKG